VESEGVTGRKVRISEGKIGEEKEG